MTGFRSVFSLANLTAGVLMIGLAPLSVSGQNQAESLSTSFRRAAERITPAVVAIRPIDPPLPGLSPLSRPFGTDSRFLTRRVDDDFEPLGSGVVIDAEKGQILTNDLFIQGALQVAVVMVDGRERQVSQVRRDPASSLAVLTIDPSGLNLTPAKWGDATALRPGDWVLSIGQYGGEPPAISSGIFSSRRRGVKRAFPTDEWLETNAAVNVLNAGGPLVNLAGEVMGIIAAPMSRRAGVVGLGFAVPAEKARRIAADLIAFGQVRRAFLGVQIEPPGLPLADRSVPPGSVMIGSVTPGTPAAEAGLAPGDRIIAIAGRPVIGSEMLQETIEYAPVGENLTLTIERGGLRSDIVVRPQPRPDGPGPGPGVSGFRLPDARRDAVRSRPRVPSTRLAPRQAPPLPRPSADDETPASLDPVPAKPASPPPPAPSLEPPRNSFDQR